MHSIENIESLGYVHIGSRWFESTNKKWKIRQWKDFSIDIYKVFHDDPEPLLVFRGYLPKLNEVQWVLGRVAI